MSKSVSPLTSKSIAVASGKGGVGKTTTAVNLALYYAKKNIRVGLVDLDPLSDIETLLDVKESEHIIRENEFDASKPGKNGGLAGHVHRVFPNMDILFPLAKLGKTDLVVLRNSIYKEHADDLSRAYDIIIFDMPAGIRDEDNLSFLRYMGSLVLVTNSEPSAHVSAGGYLKAALERRPDLPVFVWHNKYQRNPGAGFDPDDVIGNFNRNSPAEDRIVIRKENRIEHLAHIPEDASMDLLLSNSSITVNIERNLIDSIEFIKETRLRDFAISSGIPERTFELIKYFLVHRPANDTQSGFVEELGDYIGNIIRYRMGKDGFHKRSDKDIPHGGRIFTDEQIAAITTFFNKMNADTLRKRTIRLLGILDESVAALEKAKRPFLMGAATPPNRTIDLEFSRLLITLNNSFSHLPKTVMNAGGLLLFYFTLYKLFRSPTLIRLLGKFTPVRRNSRGAYVRDKYRQIRNLIEKDMVYQNRYLRLISLLFPVVLKQLVTIVKTFNLSHLCFRTKENKFNREAYAKLFSHFIHDAVNSGLGIVTGFRYRPASIAFQESAEKLLAKLSLRKN